MNRTTDPTSLPAASTPSPPTQAAVRFIFITALLEVLGFGLLIPVGPKLVQSLLHGGLGGSEEEAAPVFGLLVSTYAIMQFVFSPLLGALSDRFGRRPVLLVSIFGSGLDYIAMALAPNLWFLFITRAINGLSGASLTVAGAYIADVTTPDKRAAGFGMIGAAFGLGFTIGPVAGALLGKLDIHYPFYAAGALALISWVYGLVVLPESLPPERRAPLTLRKLNPITALAGLVRYPLVSRMAASLFLLNLAMFGLHATWVLYTTHRYNWSMEQVGLSLMLVGLTSGAVQGGLAPKIIKALGIGAKGERRALLIGLGIGVLAYIGYGSATDGWMIYTIVCAASIGGIAQPAAQALITKSVLPTEQGLVQGSLTSLQSVANIFGPIIATTAFAYFNSARTPIIIPGASFYIGAVLALIGLFIAAWATRHVGGGAAAPTPPASNSYPATSAPPGARSTHGAT